MNRLLTETVSADRLYCCGDSKNSFVTRFISLAEALVGGTRSSGAYLKDYKGMIQRDVVYKQEFVNPNELELFEELLKVLVRRGYVANNFMQLPWAPHAPITLDKILGAFCSFTDTHSGKIPQEYFPVELSMNFLSLVYERFKEKGKPINLSEQCELALDLSDGNALAAGILAHNAFRAAGRNRDTRIDTKFNFDLDTRIKLEKSVAPFDINFSPILNPLGDTYHFWAQFTAGMVYYFKQKDIKVMAKIFYLVFYHAPNLMYIVHEKVRKTPVVFGLHSNVDRMGLRIGTKIAQWLDSGLNYSKIFSK
mgnify:CR=1 FL=1